MFLKSATKSRRPVMACSNLRGSYSWKQRVSTSASKICSTNLLLADRRCLYRAGQNHGDQRNSMGHCRAWARDVRSIPPSASSSESEGRTGEEASDSFVNRRMAIG